MKQIIEHEIGIVPDTVELSGYVYVDIHLGFRKLHFLLDTGSSNTWLSEKLYRKDPYLRSMGERVPKEEKLVLFGFNGDVDQKTQYKIDTDKLRLGGHDFSVVMHTANISYHEIDGVLGMDFLMEYKAILDLGNKKLKLVV